MISKQEGGPGRGRLLLPGEQGDWAAAHLSPLPPSSSPALYGSSVPAESPFSRAPRLRGSRGTGVEPWGRGHLQIRTAHLDIGRASGSPLVATACDVIVLPTTLPK